MAKPKTNKKVNNSSSVNPWLLLVAALVVIVATWVYLDNTKKDAIPSFDDGHALTEEEQEAQSLDYQEQNEANASGQLVPNTESFGTDENGNVVPVTPVEDIPVEE